MPAPGAGAVVIGMVEKYRGGTRDDSIRQAQGTGGWYAFAGNRVRSMLEGLWKYRPWRAASGLRGTTLHQFAAISPHILDQSVHITAVGRIVENVRPYGKPPLEFRA